MFLENEVEASNFTVAVYFDYISYMFQSSNLFPSNYQGLYCSLRQLLEVGFFHADPHPGNLVAVEDGSIAYFDFGMMGDIPRHYRVGLIQVV